MRQLEEAGYHVTHDTEKPEGEIAVINTCGFIGDAKEESINMILEFAQAKEEGDLEKLKDIFRKYSCNAMWWEIKPVYDRYYSEIEYKLRIIKNKLEES